MRKIRVIPISEARPNLTAIVDEVSQSHEPCFIASHSKVKAVLIGIDEYNMMVERLEDLEDSIDILKARLANEPTRPLEEFVRDFDAERKRDVRRRA